MWYTYIPTSERALLLSAFNDSFYDLLKVPSFTIGNVSSRSAIAPAVDGSVSNFGILLDALILTVVDVEL